MDKSNRNRWLTCGIIAVVLACGGIIVGVGGLAAIGSFFNAATATSDTALVLPTNTSPAATSGDSAATEVVDAATPLPQVGNRTIPFESVVQIIALYYEGNDLVPGWTGSGTVITPDGLVLTNAHVVLSDRYYQVDALAIAFSAQEDRPPDALYFAEVLQADEALDIAVLRITTDLDYNPVDHANLNLPYVPLGDADTLRLGDDITILGYPGIGGETITLTRGEVSGFTSEAVYGDRAFIKTSATIAGGNSGGLAIDSEGYLIGIPTQLGYGGDDQYVDCRTLVDTNRDGYIDELDNCVPTGGFINAMRPVNLALPLIDAAKQGVVAINEAEPTPVASNEMPTEGSVIFQDDFSTPGGLWTSEGEAGTVTYADAQLQIELLQSEYFIWGIAGENFTDTIIDVDASIYQPAGDGDFGIICRYQDADNFYGLEISEDGYYAIWKYIAGEYVPLVNWESSSIVDQYANGGHLTAACVGNTLSLILNGTVIAEAQDSDLTYGDAGLLAGTWENAHLIVRFDNFVVSSPDN